ncbi:MAG: alpha/beta fold hydrolase [Lachnospiraceae bacterium]|nr:alpha/beta fold hydrolase [Lachnospiraceae bacterium]
MKNKIKNSIIFISFVGITIHVINKVMETVSLFSNRLNNQDNQYYEWRFGKIRFIKKGNGSPILLIHDLIPGSSQYEFNAIINTLSKTNEVYAIDLLGYGLSDKPNLTYTNYLYVQLINDFIKKIIGRKTDIIATGHAFPIAIMTCHNNPEVVNRIVGINPESLFNSNMIPSRYSKLLKLILDSPIIGTFIFNLLTTRSNIEMDFKEKYVHNSLLISDDLIEAYLESSRLDKSASKYAISSFLAKYTNANIIHALKEINNSIYLICGKEELNIDTIVNNYEYYNSSIESFTIQNTKHFPHIEEPKEFIKILSDFIH